MVTLFGISQYSATVYPKETPIAQVAKENDYVIKRIKSIDDKNGNWSYDFILLNKDLQPQIIRRNGWSFESFHTPSAWNPASIIISFRDPGNKLHSDYPYVVTGKSPYFGSFSNFEVSGLNAYFNLFFKVSEYNNWLEFLRTRNEITFLDDKYNQSQPVEISNDQEISTLKEEIEKLKQENRELKNKLEQLKAIIG